MSAPDTAVTATGWDLATYKRNYDRLMEHAKHADALAAVLADLNRCEHGRHEGDVCSGPTGCNGPSKGNPLLWANGRPPFSQNNLRQIGYDISGRPIVVPDRALMQGAAAWRAGKGVI